MKKIGILSDLHLEGSNMELINPGWDILVLAGDISSELDLLDTFFSYQCPSDIPIIYVLGNHEFENKRKEDVIPNLKKLLENYPNVHLLQNESLIIDDIKFIGTTLWSNFEGAGLYYKEQIKEWATTNIVDFSKIYTLDDNTQKYRKFSPQDMEKEFNKAYDFLNFELRNNPFEGTKFVVTHFAPTLKSSHPKYKDDMLNAYWVNNLENLMGFSDYWVHGHTHNTFTYEIEGTKVICNPRGNSKLFNLSSNPSFDKELVVEIESYQNLPTTKIRKKL